MRTPRSYIRLATAAALLGLFMSSTVITWVARCVDCAAMQDKHGCCQDTRDTRDDNAQVSALSCCDSLHTAICGTPAHFDSGAATTFESHSDQIAAQAGHIKVVALAPRARPAKTSPPRPAPGSPPPTRTIVMLL